MLACDELPPILFDLELSGVFYQFMLLGILGLAQYEPEVIIESERQEIRRFLDRREPVVAETFPRPAPVVI